MLCSTTPLPPMVVPVISAVVLVAEKRTKTLGEERQSALHAHHTRELPSLRRLALEDIAGRQEPLAGPEGKVVDVIGLQLMRESRAWKHEQQTLLETIPPDLLFSATARRRREIHARRLQRGLRADVTHLRRLLANAVEHEESHRRFHPHPARGDATIFHRLRHARKRAFIFLPHANVVADFD